MANSTGADRGVRYCRKIDCPRYQKQYYHLFSYYVFAKFSPIHAAHFLLELVCAGQAFYPSKISSEGIFVNFSNAGFRGFTRNDIFCRCRDG